MKKLRSFDIPSLNDVYMIKLLNWSTDLPVDFLFWNKEKQQNTQLMIQYGLAQWRHKIMCLAPLCQLPMSWTSSLSVEKIFNLFPNTPFWDRPKFKEAADDNWNVAIEVF